MIAYQENVTWYSNAVTLGVALNQFLFEGSCHVSYVLYFPDMCLNKYFERKLIFSGI